MIKLAKVVNETTKACDVALGTDTQYYINLGFSEQDVEQAYNGQWYLAGYAPVKPPETLEEKLNRLEKEYKMNRWQREGILAPNSEYSAYNKAKAQELEDIAEQIRNQNNGGQNE